MKLLFDIGHPAHFHLFKNAFLYFEAEGHRCLFTVRSKDTIIQLLKNYSFPYVIASKPRTGFLGLFIELIVHNFKVLVVSLKFKPNFIIGTSVSASHICPLICCKSIIFNEDDCDYVKLFSSITYPTADYIVIPDILRDPYSYKQIRHNSLHELSYLHPDNFSFNSKHLVNLNIKRNCPFILFRIVSLKAHHDIGHKGLSLDLLRKIIKLFKSNVSILISFENDCPPEFSEYNFSAPPHHMHSILHRADLFISDSQTMSTEAVILGTPAIRVNTFKNLCSIINQIEIDYELIFSFQPNEELLILNIITKLLEDIQFKKDWNYRHKQFLISKDDFNKTIIKIIETLGGC